MAQVVMPYSRERCAMPAFLMARPMRSMRLRFATSFLEVVMSVRKQGYEGFGQRIRESLQRKADRLDVRGTPGKRKPKYGISFEEFAAAIGVRLESARLYAQGLQFPGDAKVLERMAAFLDVTVGYLVAGEEEGVRIEPKAVEARDIKAPVTAETLVSLCDDAMLMRVAGLRMLGKGDTVIISPIRARDGDIVAVLGGNGLTLRRLVESGAQDNYVAESKSMPQLTRPVVIGVVTGARATLDRLAET